MSDSDNQKVMDTRKKNKAKGMTPSSRKKVVDLKAQLAELNRSIAAMESKSSTSDDAKDDTDIRCSR